MTDFTAKQRQKLADKGEAMSDGSYPIRNTQDLANAYKDYIRTGRNKAVAAHINTRAKALGIKSPITETYDDVIQRHTARIP